MKSMILFGVLLVLAIGGQVHCRAIDDDMDNSIQGANGFELRNWVDIATKPPAVVKQTAGRPIQLVCEVMGSPTPTIQWIRGQVPLSGLNDAYKLNMISEESSSSITRVRSVLVIEHSLSVDTVFTCVGQSGGKTAFASTTVKRSLPAILAPFESSMVPEKSPVTIVYSYSVVLDLIGSNVVLPCHAVGRPRPEIYWMDRHGLVNGQDSRIKVLPTGELLIADLKWDDMGNYKCMARNSVSNDTAETFIYPVSKDE